MSEVSSHSLLGTGRRRNATVTPLELFFDLIFVLAITECTSLMEAQRSWLGLTRGLLVLGVLWWSWVGYAWLTSVVDPEETSVRFSIFLAMAATLVVTLCIPDAFGERALAFAVAYAVVRTAQILLFVLGSRGDPGLRSSVLGLAASSAIGVGLLIGASFAHPEHHEGLQIVLWGLAMLIDVGGPFLFGSDGWKLVPGHFAERHGLIVLIALGESIIAVGVGAREVLDGRAITAIVAGLALVAALWWEYFDRVADLAAERLEQAPPGRERNELARDSYSLLHFPMAAGIVLVALGLRLGLEHLDRPLTPFAATALCGGAALYRLAHVGFCRRMIGAWPTTRLVHAVALVGLAVVARHVSSMTTLVLMVVLAWAAIAVEALLPDVSDPRRP
jgi:low temperature requirement protein LtrA